MDDYRTTAPDLYAVPTVADQYRAAETGEPAAPHGNLSEPLAALLQRFGVAPSATHDEVHDRVLSELAARSIQAKVVSLRYGELVVSATPHHAALLRYETDRLVGLLAESHPGQVSRISIRTRR